MENTKKGGFFRNLLKDCYLDDDFEEDFNEYDFNNSWFHRQYQETAYKNGVKKSVQEKLFTDKKLTFEEYTTLLEIVTEKFRDSFNCNNGKFDIIFRERTLEEKVNKVLEKQTDKENESEDKEIKFYTKEEVEKLINEMQTERLVFIDDGIDEVIGRFRDLPDIIVDLNRKFGSKDLKIRNFIEPEDEPIIETFGMFLHKISFEDREKIIDRLNKLQQNEEEIYDYKLVDMEDLANYFKSRDEER